MGPARRRPHLRPLRTNTPDVTLERISKDGVELAEYLCRELGKKKIIVLGHSLICSSEGRSLPEGNFPYRVGYRFSGRCGTTAEW
jgi:hypothetical protein